MIIQKTIEEKLQSAFLPDHLQVINESYQHSVPEGSESHFKLVIVSEQFSGKRPVQRQQQVYKALAEELSGPVHALTMQTLTPQEWDENPAVSVSPQCMGGSQADQSE